MRALTAPLAGSETFRSLSDALRPPASFVLCDGCAPSQKLHLIHALASEQAGIREHARSVLIVTHSDLRARQICEEYSFYDRTATLFPAKDLIFYQADLRGREIQRERLRCLRRILEGRPTAVVTTFSALMTPQVPLRVLREHVLPLEKRGRIGRDTLAGQLVAMGYTRNYQAEAPGQFAVRGDIVDIFDLTEENPYRIELWDDEIDSIRSYDAQSQRSIEQLSAVSIYPATELVLDSARLADGLDRIRDEASRTEIKLRGEKRIEEAHRLRADIGAMIEEAEQWQDYGRLESYIHYFYPHTESFLDLFDRERTLLVFDEPARLTEHADAVEAEFRESMVSRAEKGYVLPGQMAFLSSARETLARTEDFRRAAVAELAAGSGMFPDKPCFLLHTRSAAPYNRSFETLCTDLARLRRQKYRTVLLSGSRTRARRLAADLTDLGISAFYSEDPDRAPEPGEIMTYYGHIAQGFEYTELRFLVIAETDIFGARAAKRRKKHRYEGEKIADFADMKIGDYVVHEDHGVGIYRGVEKIEIDHVAKDYIKIEYGGGGTLYVLPTELDVLQKYASAGTAKPKLNKLGSSEWAASKAKVKGAVEEVADDLVQLYAHRREKRGHAFGQDTVWQHEFEELFPFEETQDQLTAIADTKRDMESDRIMDRLICGDVGYGKTEIAIRAAFKAVQDGKQVAVLVPTTILAQQHFNTFTDRMKNYPVTVELLSRFRTPAEQKKTVQGLASGRVDIVIGTHRILSKDVKFKDLGLLVVDEEQRFGVTHKEKIKKMKEDVDVLTLTATPIPRTLHMSLVGIRDMSVLEEAPEDRVPIQTYILEYNEEMVREAILRELSRRGQVYYVYNRTDDIADVAARLQKLVPEAQVSFAHGQMGEGDLEKVMYDFISGSIDVLVSTTIIETGLDISNVNTIIVHDSDRMGLAQLYQLRGRVGRSDRTAYAFLMYRRDKVLKEIAEKRLSAIREFTDLGSGFRIAMRDLEIRGAGSILGRSQHGHMQAVGYDLYCKLLDTAVRRAKGEEVHEEKNVGVNLSVEAYIPAAYIMNEVQKLGIYKRIAQIGSTEDCDDVREELIDRFGEIPAPAQNLLRIALIRSVARHLDVADITGFTGSAGAGSQGAGTIRFTLEPDAAVRVENIPSFLSGYKGAMAFSPKGAPAFTYTFRPSGVTVRDEETLLSSTEDILVRMAQCLR